VGNDKPEGKKSDAKPPEPKPPVAPRREPVVLALDERRYKYAELIPYASTAQAGELVAMLADGRAIVRANAALALAAGNHAVPELIPLLRDSEASVALAAGEALGRLGPLAGSLAVGAAQAVGGARPEVIELVVATFAELVGKADHELVEALDVPEEVAHKGVIAACARVGGRGVGLLVQATAHERSRIRINAVAGLALLGKSDPDVAMAGLTRLEASDPVPDVRRAAKKAMLAVVAREKVEVADELPKNIPDFEARKLSASELAEYTETIEIDPMMFALRDGRDHVRINAARALAVAGARAGRAAPALGLLVRDSVAGVRREAAKALGKLGEAAVAAAPDLVGALGDDELEVVDATTDTLAALGERALDALVRGLETGGEEHGRRIAELISRAPDAARRLTEAFASPSVNVQVNAAYGFGLLGRERVGSGLEALRGARTGGDARTREAVRRALEVIEAKGETGPKAVAISGFEERFLSAAELDKHAAELGAVGVTDLTAHLMDGRDVVRGNAATALGVIGAAAAGAALPLGVLLRDDAPRVRLAAAQALDRIGDAAVIETADSLVGALRDPDEQVTAACAATLRARKARMVGALVRGLETGDPDHARRIVEVLGALPDASEILCDAFESPAVNVQVNAALGLGLLGPARVGNGRRLLEGARTGGDARTREAVRKALDLLDGPRKTGPDPVAVAGFEERVLEPSAFADPAKLRVEDLIAHLVDGRPVVRANAATALGAVGPAALAAIQGIAVLLRDDDLRVRIAAAGALDRLGDDAVREVASFLVGALRGDPEVARACATALAARKVRVLGALVKGLETDDEVHAARILELILALPDACEILTDAFESPAENVQVNAAIGIGMLGAKRAGAAGKKKLEGARTGGFARTREAVFKALAMLKQA
jgi:HEAT repeat protein